MPVAEESVSSAAEGGAVRCTARCGSFAMRRMTVYVGILVQKSRVHCTLLLV